MSNENNKSNKPKNNKCVKCQYFEKNECKKEHNCNAEFATCTDYVIKEKLVNF